MSSQCNTCYDILNSEEREEGIYWFYHGQDVFLFFVFIHTISTHKSNHQKKRVNF